MIQEDAEKIQRECDIFFENLLKVHFKIIQYVFSTLPLIFFFKRHENDM